MKNTELQTHLEFLAKIFSEPDIELMEKIRLGETPLGQIKKTYSELSFADEKMVLVTDLFVNSQNARPIFPLATENLANKNAKGKFLDQLISYYAIDNKVSTNYPPDHLKVMFEFLLFKLSNYDIAGAKDFYTIFLKPWYNRFSEAIINRSDDQMAVKLANLINETMRQVEKL